MGSLCLVYFKSVKSCVEQGCMKFKVSKEIMRNIEGYLKRFQE